MLIANERKDRLALVAAIVVALGHEVTAREIDVADVGAVTARERPDVALVGLGDSSEHAARRQRLDCLPLIDKHRCERDALEPGSDVGGRGAKQRRPSLPTLRARQRVALPRKRAARYRR